MKKNIGKLTLYYAIGFLIYSTILYLTQCLLLNVLGLTREEIHILFYSPIINVILYTLLFCFITFMLYVYDQTSVKELNIALKEMKERIKANGEQVRENRSNNTCDSNNSIGSI